MMRIASFRAANLALLLAATALAVWRNGLAAPQDERGTLKISVLDAATGKPVPARVEVLDKGGRGHVAGDAVPVGGD